MASRKRSGAPIWTSYALEDERLWEEVLARPDERWSPVLRETFLAALALSPDALWRLKDIERFFRRRAGFDLPVQVDIAHWADFVMEVETGYEMSEYDYANDLAGRQLLEDAMQAVPEMRSRVEGMLRAWDDRLRQATLQTDEPLGGRFEERNGKNVRKPLEKIAWWWWRWPKRWPEGDA